MCILLSSTCPQLTVIPNFLLPLLHYDTSASWHSSDKHVKVLQTVSRSEVAFTKFLFHQLSNFLITVLYRNRILIRFVQKPGVSVYFCVHILVQTRGEMCCLGDLESGATVHAEFEVHQRPLAERDETRQELRKLIFLP